MHPFIDRLFQEKRLKKDLSLVGIRQLLEALDNPQRRFAAVHVGGTNGKGSTCAFLASVLQEAGCKVGLYTSPHLIRFNERIKIDGEDIPEDVLDPLIERLKNTVEQHSIKISFFEFSTVLAFLYFAEQQVDIAVVEVGLGGRLDATNVIFPLVSIITNISIDHEETLGKTLPQIAREKAGIIKDQMVLVTAEERPEVLQILQDACRERHAKFLLVSDHPVTQEDWSGQTFESPLGPLKIPFLGKHQVKNAQVALQALFLLKKEGFSVSKEAIIVGMAKARWPGRLQVLSEKPLIIIDGAHNVAGMQVVREFLQGKIPADNMLLLGISEDKQIPEIVKLIAPLFKKIIVTKGIHKPADPTIIETEVRKYAADVQIIPEAAAAFSEARRQISPEGMLLVTGSLYLVGEVLKGLEGEYLRFKA